MKTLILITTLISSINSFAVPNCWNNSSSRNLADGSFIIDYVTRGESAIKLANLLASLDQNMKVGRIFSYDYGEDVRVIDVWGDGNGVAVESSIKVFVNAQVRRNESRNERINRINLYLDELERKFNLEISCNGQVGSINN